MHDDGISNGDPIPLLILRLSPIIRAGWPLTPRTRTRVMRRASSILSDKSSRRFIALSILAHEDPLCALAAHGSRAIN